MKIVCDGKEYELTHDELAEANTEFVTSFMKRELMERMSLHRFIQILDKHHEGLSVNHIIYKRLNDIRDLRNKIHLTCTEKVATMITMHLTEKSNKTCKKFFTKFLHRKILAIQQNNTNF